MRKEYNFSQGTRDAVLPSPGKTRVTIMLHNEVIEAFRARADATGQRYQTLINAALHTAIDPNATPVTVGVLRTMLTRNG